MALWSHVCIIMEDPPPPWPADLPRWLTPPWLAAPLSWLADPPPPPPPPPGITQSHDHVMDGRGRSAFTLTKRTCYDWRGEVLGSQINALFLGSSDTLPLPWWRHIFCGNLSDVDETPPPSNTALNNATVPIHIQQAGKYFDHEMTG